MPKLRKPDPAAAPFKTPESRAVYRAVLAGLRARVGRANAAEDPKRTCVHVTAGPGGTAYLGLHPRTNGLLLTVRTAAPIDSPRVRQCDRVSANRCHCDL